MDLVLHYADEYLSLDSIYLSPALSLARDNIFRQAVSLFFITLIGGYLVYLIPASLSFWFIYDKNDMKHTRFLPNQVSKEIAVATKSLPWMTVMTTFVFLFEVRGHSKLYDDLYSRSLLYNVLICVWFLVFTDCLIYWIHRGLHHPSVYGTFHKIHHLWIIPTPFASHAFHPVDGFLQSCPYHIFAFLFPVQKHVYLGLFVFVNIWSVLIHDGRHVVFDEIINGAAHHTIHHTGFKYNYGQYFTLWDKIGGSYKKPSHAPKTEVFKEEEKEAEESLRRKKRTE